MYFRDNVTVDVVSGGNVASAGGCVHFIHACHDTILFTVQQTETHLRDCERPPASMPPACPIPHLAGLQVGLEGYAHMPDALRGLSRAERVTYCNDAWRAGAPRLAVLDFSRDRKMMSVLAAVQQGGSPTLFLKVRPPGAAGAPRCSRDFWDAASVPAPLGHS